MLFTFMMIGGLSAALFFWAGPKYAPQIMTKKGLDGFKAKLQGRYHRAKNVHNQNGNKKGRYDYLEGAEDFEATTTIAEYGKNLKGNTGEERDIKDYSRYANEINNKSNQISKDLKEGRFQKLINRAKPKMKAFFKMIKDKAQSAVGSNQLPVEKGAEFVEKLENVELELDNRADMSSEKKER